MIELSIHFASEEKDETSPITVRLFRPDSGAWTTPVPFEIPLDDAVLADLRWYLEVFSGWPTGPDYERAERIEAQFEDWGRALLANATPDRGSAQMWQQFCDAPVDGKLITIDSIEPRVLRLPWELLADEGGHLFARGIGVRRRLKKVTGEVPRPFALPLRVLVVVSRPEDKGIGFLDPRADARPLLDALDELGARVEVEFLYPPTLRALTDRLRDRAAPPVHVVHFDGHGVYDTALGLGYLLFENKAHEMDRVDATRLGTLLSGRNVPLMVLSACQSAAQQEGNPYASIAARLIRANVGSVLAMNYSVLDVAARMFVEAFYGGLARGLSVGQAVDEGRYALMADNERGTLTRRNAEGELVEEATYLSDWFLPALYQQAGDPVVFDPTAALGGLVETSEVSALPRALIHPTAPGGLPADPPHGFFGRAREMLNLERALAEKAVVVLHGFGGLGKTALAAEAGRWFHRTGRFPGGAAFVSFEHGGSLSQLCSWVGQAVSGDPDFAIGEGDPVERVGALLRERPALVILDNFESVLGHDPLMPPEEVAEVLAAVWGWATARGSGRSHLRSRVLITTRDTTFADARFKPSKQCAYVPLEGLTTTEALALAAAVLDDHGIDRAAIDREALENLMGRLGGHPLSLNLALPHLRRFSPAELSDRFEELLPGFTAGAAVERNESLEVSLAFSLQRLGEETRAALPDLAVFQGGCLESELLAITEIDPTLWAAARSEMEAAALVTVETVPGVEPPFLRFHPTLLPYLARELDGERRAGLEARYWQRYHALAGYLYNADDRTPHQARAIALREMPNLRRALALCLEAGAAAEAVAFADRIAQFLDLFGRWREREAMMGEVRKLEIGGEGPITKAEYLLQSGRGEALLQQGRVAEAEALFRELLARLEADPVSQTGAAYDARYDHALTLAWLGRCLADQGQPSRAIDCHRRALAGFEALSASDEQAKTMVGKVYPDLGDNLAALGQFDEAQRAYESGLDVAREIDDHRTIGVVLNQLGTLALRRGALDEAERRYSEALETFRALGEPRSEAIAWHQLGMVAQKAAGRGSGDWDEAERCYREAVRIREQIRDYALLATTSNQLANVAQQAGRPADAERWYLRALAGFQQTGQRQYTAAASNNLAHLYLTQGRLDEAERYARRALEIKETLDLSAEPWVAYATLAGIAAARGRPEEAAEWRRKEQESYAAYAGAAHQIRQYQPLITAAVQATQGDAAALASLEGEYPKMEAAGSEWQQAAAAIQRIVAGETDVDALTTGMSRTPALIIRAILAQLSGEAPPQPPKTSEGSGEPEATQSVAAHPTPEVPPEIARILEQFEPVIGAVVAACGGNEDAARQLEPLLDHMAQEDDWRDLVAVLRRILAGERDAEALLPGLDATDSVVVAAVLSGLGVPISQGQQQGITLDGLLKLVAQACGPDAPPGLGEQLHGLTQTIAGDPNAPPELQALARVLNRILSGERDPDLSTLSSELADAVRGMLTDLG